MSVGSVSVSGIDGSGNPVRTGSGAALALFDAMVIAKAAVGEPPLAPVEGSTTAPYQAARPASSTDVAAANAGRLSYFRDLASTCNGMAGIVSYITANAKAHVTTEILGKTPNPNDPDTDIQAPSAPVDIPII